MAIRASVAARSVPQIAPGEPPIEVSGDVSIAQRSTASASSHRRRNAAACQPGGWQSGHLQSLQNRHLGRVEAGYERDLRVWH